MTVRRNRFGISLLSKDNFLDAWDEEMMVDKDTGEVLIKSGDDVLSYPYLLKINQHINAFTDKFTDLGLSGSLKSVVNEIKRFPYRTEIGENLLDTPLSLGNSNKHLMISLSADTFTTDGLKTYLNIEPFTVTIILSGGELTEDVVIVKTMTYEDSLVNTINLSDYNYESANITDIHIGSIDNVYDTPPIVIAHSILVFRIND